MGKPVFLFIGPGSRSEVFAFAAGAWAWRLSIHQNNVTPLPARADKREFVCSGFSRLRSLSC